MSTRSVVRDYVAISKPRIIFLLLIVGYAAMFVAANGWPGARLFLALTVAGTLSTASSGAFNHVLEREQDRQMARTADRPIASGRISVRAGLLYATLMGALSFLAMVAVDRWFAAWLTLGAIVYYTIIYTVILKPSTTQNIVIGGFAGSFPALIGWATVTGDLGAAAWLLAGLVFVWTPAHFWALAMMYKEDYAAANYPMLPVVKGDDYTLRWMLVYSILTAITSVALVWPMKDAGLIYLVGAAVLGAALIARNLKIMRIRETKAYRSFFFFTIQYLGVLLVILMVDQLVTWNPLYG